MAVTAEGDRQRSEHLISPPHNSGTKAQDGGPTALASPPIVCPVCGGTNPPGAVFCGNPACHKALGDFKYVLEELRAEAQWHHIVADHVTALIAKPH